MSHKISPVKVPIMLRGAPPAEKQDFTCKEVYEQFCSPRIQGLEKKLDTVIEDNKRYKEANERLTYAFGGAAFSLFVVIGYLSWSFLPSKFVKFAEFIRKTGLSG